MDRKLTWDLEQAIPEASLEHGAYYSGDCRNASVARWHAQRRRWYYWREKWGGRWVEDLQPMEDAEGNRIDYFAPTALVDWGVEEIPFPEEGSYD